MVKSESVTSPDKHQQQQLHHQQHQHQQQATMTSLCNKPKGPMSAYACFVQVVREEHRRKHPEENIQFSELARKCSEKWKTLGPRERKRFEDMATCDKDRYLREMSNYITEEQMLNAATATTRRGMKRKKIKDPNMPKRGWSAFFFYCDEFRAKIRQDNPDWKVGDVARELGKRWEQCSDKSKYEVLANADKERYDREMAAYRAGNFVKKPKEVSGESNTNEEEIEDIDDEEEEEDDIDSHELSGDGAAEGASVGASDV